MKNNYKILITGATGFIGKNLTDKLIMMNHEIMIISRKEQDSFDHINLKWVRGDIANINQYSKIIKNFSPEIVIHLYWEDIPIFSIENGNTFSSEATPKKKYLPSIDDIKKNNLSLISKIKNIKKTGNTVAAFQTRNIPHFGHEKIIEDLLLQFNYVIINPVIGPKKAGDAKSDLLSLIYNHLGKKYYDNKIIFHPLCANMFYAGPREAIHHALLRQKVGFSGFIIGRDHAGAQNNYRPESAKIQINRIK